MQDLDFYSYMYGSAVPVCDELAGEVDFSNEESINKAFVSYLNDNPPPYNMKDCLLEEKFYFSDGEGKNGDETILRYDMDIPGMDEDADGEEIKKWFEEFLDRAGAQDGSKENSTAVEIEMKDNERGGQDCYIYVAVKGEQIKKK